MKQTENIKISIIIPVYNIERYIGKCLESLIKQTYNNIEIIVINDGSTDQSLNVIEKYCENDLRIELINQENQGVNEARKNGYLHSSGDYLLFVDGDDWLEIDAIDKLVDIAIKHNPDIILFDIIRVNNEKKVPLVFNYLDTSQNEINLLEKLFLYDIHPSIWFKTVKKSFK